MIKLFTRMPVGLTFELLKLVTGPLRSVHYIIYLYDGDKLVADAISPSMLRVIHRAKRAGRLYKRTGVTQAPTTVYRGSKPALLEHNEVR